MKSSIVGLCCGFICKAVIFGLLAGIQLNGFVIAQDYDSMTGEEVYELFEEERSEAGKIDYYCHKLLKTAADKGYWRAQWTYGKYCWQQAKQQYCYIYMYNLREGERYMRSAVRELGALAEKDSSLSSEYTLYRSEYQRYERDLISYESKADKQEEWLWEKMNDDPGYNWYDRIVGDIYLEEWSDLRFKP